MFRNCLKNKISQRGFSSLFCIIFFRRVDKTIDVVQTWPNKSFYLYGDAMVTGILNSL